MFCVSPDMPNAALKVAYGPPVKRTAVTCCRTVCHPLLYPPLSTITKEEGDFNRAKANDSKFLRRSDFQTSGPKWIAAIVCDVFVSCSVPGGYFARVLPKKVQMKDTVMTESTFRARDIGLRAQKKILSKMAGKNIARAFIDDVTASILDNLYRLAKQYSNNKKESEKLVKNIIKIVIKLAVLHRNNMFSSDELKQAERFKTRFRGAAMTIISFYEVDFSYDRPYLTSALVDCQQCLKSIVQRHLTDKSLARIDSVFNFFTDEKFLDSVFKRDSEYREVLGRLVTDLNKAIENGDL
ncbi:hypothetical protein WA026_011531 [Henosepilachna vigintioctopunctata]|uniref:Tumor necrosis factor alpha-induced protein 8-like protein n=1 Tax=Henosepilachna vigintioctopunctata TaxID=420089 RepID=A0AAW1TRF4_9CUCU